ncbi:MAG: AI-2E family transporter [Planctomycetaceae bacterium]
MPLIPRLVSLGVILTLIIFLGITFYKVITPFLMPLFLAAITAILCQPLYKKCLKWSKGKPEAAARSATVIIISGVMLPLIIGISAAAYQMIGIDTEAITQKIEETREKIGLDAWLVKIGFDKFLIPEEEPLPTEPDIISEDPPSDNPDDFNLEVEQIVETPEGIDPDLVDAGSAEAGSGLVDPESETAKADPAKLKIVREELNAAQTKLKLNMSEILKSVGEKSLGGALGIFTNVGSAVGSVFIALLIYILALYYFFADGPGLIDATQKLIPVHVYYQNELLTQFESVVRAIILATLAAAISQGLATAGIMYLLGSGHFFLFFGIATMFAMIPLLGTWIVWGPFAIYLFVQGQWISAIILTLFGAIVIGMMDNVIRTLILKDGAKLHPLLAFVSVLGGLQVLGLWGVFIGPTVASCLYALVKIFNVELKSLSAEQFGPDKMAMTEKTPSASNPAPTVVAEEAGNKEDPAPPAGDSSNP